MNSLEIEFHVINTGTGHEWVIKVSYIKQELSYLPDSIVCVSYKLFKVKLKCCAGFYEHHLSKFVLYLFILGVECHVIFFHFKNEQYLRYFSCREGRLSPMRVLGTFFATNDKNAHRILNNCPKRVNKHCVKFNLCASKRSSSQMFWLSGRVNIP